MSANLTTLSGILKEVYGDPSKIATEMYDAKLLGIFQKYDDHYGEDIKQPLITDGPENMGPFVNAQANEVNSQTQVSAFTLYRRKFFQMALIDGEAIRATNSEEGAFLSARKLEIDKAYRSLARELAVQMYRDGTGIRASTSAATSVNTPTITLANPGDAKMFAKGMALNVYSVSGSAVITNTASGLPQKAIVTKVSQSANTITIAANWNTTFGSGTCSATIAAGDGLARDGCIQTAGQSVLGNPVLDGLSAWIPLADPGSTLFNGVDRSTDTTKLGGVRIPFVAGTPISEVAIKLISEVGANGGKADLLTLAPTNFASLLTELQAKKSYTVSQVQRPAQLLNGETSADVAYNVVRILGPDAEVEVMSDSACPYNAMWALETGSWELHSCNTFPFLVDEDGLTILRAATADAFEARICALGSLSCRAPSHNGVAQLF